MRFNRTTYGEKIKQLRINKGLTQEQLAEKMNVSGTYIVKMVSGSVRSSWQLSWRPVLVFHRATSCLVRRHEAGNKQSSQL